MRYRSKAIGTAISVYIVRAPYAVKSKIQRVREEGMRAPVSKPPLTWRRFGEMHWSLVVLNNIGFIIQTILFMIGTLIGILVAPL
jgi:hypothetical protein